VKINAKPPLLSVFDCRIDISRCVQFFMGEIMNFNVYMFVLSEMKRMKGVDIPTFERNSMGLKGSY